MQSGSQAPQIAVVSWSREDHIRPLVAGLRARGLDAWWNHTDLSPGQNWERQTLDTLQQARATCVTLDEKSLLSADFLQIVQTVLKSDRVLLGVRIGAVNASLVPEELRRLQWIDYLGPADLNHALDLLEQQVRPVTGRPTPSNPPRQKKGSEETPGPRAMTLRFGDTESAETGTVSEDLWRIVEEAANLNLRENVHTRFPVSFTTLLRSLFSTGNSWTYWLGNIGRESGLDLGDLTELPVHGGEFERPLRTTSSAARLLQSARKFAQQSSVIPDVQHLIAALIYEPAGHEEDLQKYQFNRVTWANALIAEVEQRSPADVRLFTSLRDQAFPVTKNPIFSDAASASNAAESSPTVTAEWRRDFWARADTRCREAFAWAAAARESLAAAHVGLRELAAGLVRTVDDDNIWKFIGSISPELVAGEGQPAWAAFLRKLGVSVTSPIPVAELPDVTSEVEAVLASALTLQGKLTGPAELLPPQAIFLALWQPDSPGGVAPIDRLLPDAGYDRDAFLRMILQGELDEKARAVFQELSTVRKSFGQWDRAHVDSDRVDGPIPLDRDLLDAGRPALRFAKLLAARDVNPPIALGLFGNWGSGKTFFMGLMRDRIASLANDGGDYVRRVVQIEFNAWHYHDTNLWASLAMRIFEGLALELAGKKESEVEAIRKALHQKLRSSEARRNEAKDRRTQALSRRAKVTKDLEDRRADRADLEKRSVTLRLEAAWSVVTTQPMFEKFQLAVKDLGNHFGIDRAIKSAEDMDRLRQDIEETSGRALGLFTAIGQRFHGLTRIAQTVALLMLAVTAALGLGRGFEWVAEQLKIKLPDFSSIVVEVAAIVTTATAWCGRRVKEIRSAVDYIGKVEAALAAAEKTVLPIELQKLQTEILNLDKAIHQATEELAAAEREFADATAEIDRINRGGLVYDFLQERRASSSYVGQLGLISTIRQDLDRLGALLKDFAKEGENPIERIILYIDDLDRCHPDKVVEVLQAVHLLLAFDLFNVVVGVDARWLERSLRRQYVGRSERKKHEDTFSPQDYLEKIFQIPYALGRLDETGFKKLIAGIIETRSQYLQKESERARVKEQSGEQQRQSEPNALVDANAAASNVEGNAGEKTDTPLREGPGGPDGVKEPDAVKKEPVSPASKTSPRPATGGVAPTLYFEDHEETFVQLLYEFIDRPRLAKRFINIYRLLRVRADDEGETIRFAGGPNSPDYRAALILLAIHVGHPTVAAQVIHALVQANDKQTWAGLLDEIAAGRIVGIVSTDRERTEVKAIIQKLEVMGPRVPAELHAYRRWAPRVACYSFDWHRPETNPRPAERAGRAQSATNAQA